MDKAKILLEQSDKKIHDNLNVIEMKEISYGKQYKVQINHENYILRIFYNKKGEIKIDYSTIKDDEVSSQLAILLDDKDLHTEEKISKKEVVNKSIGINTYSNSIGTDESGKGDYFGPLVVAGVFINENTEKILLAKGVMDSKKISDDKIMHLANFIKANCQNMYSVIEITPKTYNQLYSQFKNEGKNLNTLLAWGHAKAIEELLGKVYSEIAISDQFADEKYIISKLQEKGRKINLVQEHKAEKYTSVAAASILARERFLVRLKKMNSEYSMTFSKGASQNIIKQAQEFVEKYGKDSLQKVAKLHFKTTDQII